MIIVGLRPCEGKPVQGAQGTSMAEFEKINVETGSHMGHVIRVWHDCETRWFYDVDGTNPQRVSFSFETGFDFERQRAQAKQLAHQAVHALALVDRMNAYTAQRRGREIIRCFDAMEPFDLALPCRADPFALRFNEKREVDRNFPQCI